MLECPVCLNSLLEPAAANERPCPAAHCSPAQLCGSCVTVASKGKSSRKPPKTVNRTFNASQSLNDTSVTPCGHLFHSRCLKDWIKETLTGKPTCPNCRKPFTQARVVQVYLDASRASGYDVPPLPSDMCGLGTSVTKATPAPVPTPVACYSSSSSSPLNTTSVIRSTNSNSNCSTHHNPNFAGASHQIGNHPIILLDPPGTSGNPEDLDPRVYEGGSLSDLKMIHNTLISDFNDLKSKYLELRDEDEFHKGQLLSFEDENQQLKAELQKYQQVGDRDRDRDRNRPGIPMMGMINSFPTSGSSYSLSSSSHNQFPSGNINVTVPNPVHFYMNGMYQQKRGSSSPHPHEGNSGSSLVKRARIVVDQLQPQQSIQHYHQHQVPSSYMNPYHSQNQNQNQSSQVTTSVSYSVPSPSQIQVQLQPTASTTSNLSTPGSSGYFHATSY